MSSLLLFAVCVFVAFYANLQKVTYPTALIEIAGFRQDSHQRGWPLYICRTTIKETDHLLSFAPYKKVTTQTVERSWNFRGIALDVPVCILLAFSMPWLIWKGHFRVSLRFLLLFMAFFAIVIVLMQIRPEERLWMRYYERNFSLGIYFPQWLKWSIVVSASATIAALAESTLAKFVPSVLTKQNHGMHTEDSAARSVVVAKPLVPCDARRSAS